jgi:hypothetical protein
VIVCVLSAMAAHHGEWIYNCGTAVILCYGITDVWLDLETLVAWCRAELSLVELTLSPLLA